MRKKRESDYYDACWNEIEPKRDQNINKTTKKKKKKVKKESKYPKALKVSIIILIIIYIVHFILRPDVYPYIIYIITQCLQ